MRPRENNPRPLVVWRNERYSVFRKIPVFLKPKVRMKKPKLFSQNPLTNYQFFGKIEVQKKEG
jgi:hypothetical protein